MDKIWLQGGTIAGMQPKLANEHHRPKEAERGTGQPEADGSLCAPGSAGSPAGSVAKP